MSAIGQSWDGFFINLDRSTERRAHMEKQLQASGLGHYRRFSASDGNLIRTKSTRGRKSKLPMIGDPDRISTETPLNRSTIACAIARQRRKCPSPKLSWL